MTKYQPIFRVTESVSPARTTTTTTTTTGPLGVVDSLAVPVRCRRGQEIYSAESSVECWYRVLAGAARRFTLRTNGRRQIVDLLLPGDVFGFGADGKHYFSAEAVGTDTVIAQYPRSSVEKIAASDSMIAAELREMVKQETSRLQTLILILGGITAEEKVGAFLVNLADRLSVDTFGPVPLPISRYDIADFLALSVETVSRALTSLKERGMITLMGPRKVKIVDRGALAGGDYGAQPNTSYFAWHLSRTDTNGVKLAARCGAQDPVAAMPGGSRPADRPPRRV
ncbi:MAG: family transcriptional regulator, nitrogen fixation regulation protein, partial [Acetobacteraceae bacterium]|jgi:CRP/FNR family nitrogen fixation transcriptional regulator|nr:family transcriptional regulator, nitrogen fixation regulation protein [Acetobacteraceae bacterium]